jgi:hypothetical protein
MREIIQYLDSNYHVGKCLHELADPNWGEMIIHNETQMFYEFEHPEYLTNELSDFFDESREDIQKAIWEWLKLKGVEPQDWWLEPAVCLTKEEVEELRLKNSLPRKFVTQISDEQLDEWERILRERSDNG